MEHDEIAHGSLGKMIIRLRTARRFSLVLAPLIFVTVFLLMSHKVEATNKFWIAAGPGNFNDDANWSLSSGGPNNTTAPGAGDVPFFDAGGLGNCTIAANAIVLGFNIGSGYTGTIAVAPGSTLTVSGGFSQSAGIFNGGNSNIDIDGNFLLQDTGVFNSTSATLFLGAAFTHNTSSNPGGTFNHNNGTVTFDGSDGGINSDVSGTVFKNVNFNHTAQRIVSGRMGGGPTITVLGALALNDGQLFGSQIEVRGELNISPNFDGAPSGPATLVIANGTGSRTITFAVGTNILNVILNDPNATIQTSGSGTLNWRALTLQAGTINQGFVDFSFPPNGPGNYTQSGGTFNCSANSIAFQSQFDQSAGTFNGGSGNIDIDGNFALYGTGVLNSTTGTLFLGRAFDHDTASLPGGTFNHNNGTVVFDGNDSGGLNFPLTGETFNNLAFTLPDSGQRSLFSGLAIALGTLTLNNGTLFGGTLEARGNVVIANTFDGGSNTMITFSGSNNQTFINSGGANPSGTWTINKPARSVALLSDLTLSTVQSLNITQGVLDQNSFTITAGPITIASAGKLMNTGTGDLILGGNVVNEGIVDLNGNGGACGDADTVLIRSSASPTQRLWSGSGTFFVQDVDVQDQAGSASIIAFSSTSSGNNGGNWDIRADCNGAPTEISLESFSATAYRDGTLIEWKTGFECDNLGFRLYRDDAGKRKPVNVQLIAGSALTAGATLLAGRSYSWWDSCETAGDCGNAAYWLEDIDLKGSSTWHGPFFPNVDRGVRAARFQSALLSALGRTPTDSTRAVEVTASPATSSIGAPGIQSSIVAQPAAKITVRREGWYRVSQSELGTAGFNTRVDPRTLQLYVDGREIPILVKGEKDGSFDSADSVQFYGTGVDSPFTDLRVYWLIAGSQAGLRVEEARPAETTKEASSFAQSVERKDRSIYFSALRNGDRENFFGAVISTNRVDQVVTLHHLVERADDAEVEVALQGVTAVLHRVRVELNGAYVDDLVFNGQSQGVTTFRALHSSLKEGQNTLSLTAGGGPADVSLVDHIRITYQHTFAADNDVLNFTTDGNQQVKISGFTSPSIRVVDVTDRNKQLEIAGTVKKQEDRYAIAFATPAGGNRRLLVFTNELAPVSLTLNQSSKLRATNAEFIVISPGGFASTLRPLISLRERERLSVALVDVEDVYDEFSFGQKTPFAIRDYLSYARTNWKKKPRYVLFAGDASYDPKNYLGFGDFDFVPTRLMDTDYMETASDDWFSDFNDGIGEIATGRLPARTAGELSSMVAKIVGHQRSDAGEEALMVADANDGYDFELATDELITLIPGNLRITRVNRGRMEPEKAKNCLLEAIYRKQFLVNYVGHGSVDLWRGELLRNEEAVGLRNEHLPLFVMMTCLNGYFDDPALDSLGEALLKAEGGGIAVWASSGMTLPHEQALVNQELFRLLFDGSSSLTIGEAVMRAKAKSSSADVRRTWILLGDPSMKLR